MEEVPTIYPETVDAVREVVRAEKSIRVLGAGSKPALADFGSGCRVSTSCLSGVLDYDPAEYTFTARAGTPVAEIQAMVEEKGQYLPFDPLFAGSATLGGTLAAGANGPGSFRFGGLRDFILGIRFVDGRGDLITGGGTVVKNAAGFDLPKFFAGSLGRFGILTELTFKVFPSPGETLT
ncbi:MAG: FAD-binding protein, partial [Verrucomicrobiota bacterium]